MTRRPAGQLAKDAEVQRLLLTHFGPLPEQAARNLVAAEQEFTGPVHLVRAGIVYEL